MTWLDRAGFGATLLLPLFLLHGRGLAEVVTLPGPLIWFVKSPAEPAAKGEVTST